MSIFKFKDTTKMPITDFTIDVVEAALVAKDNALIQAKLALNDAITEMNLNLNTIETGQGSITADLEELEIEKKKLLEEQSVLVKDREDVLLLLKQMKDMLNLVSPPDDSFVVNTTVNFVTTTSSTDTVMVSMGDPPKITPTNN